MVTYQKLKHNNASVVQVESAIRDGNGVKIDTNYARKAIILSDTQVTFSSNPDTGTNTDYPYRGAISATGVTSSTPVDVTFADEQANSLHYASWCTTDTDVIYLYSTVNDTITIPTVTIGLNYTSENVDSSPTAGSVYPVSSGGVYTALGTKQDNLTFDTTPTSASTNPVTSAGIKTAIEAMYPVGSIYMNATSSTNPGTLFGFGTWQELAPGRVLMGAGTDSEITGAPTYAAGDLPGEYTHTLTTTEMPSHGHSVSVNSTSTEHTHSGTTGNQNALHTHSGTTGTESANHSHDSGTLAFTTNGVISQFNDGSSAPSGYGHLSSVNLIQSGGYQGSRWSGEDYTFKLSVNHDNATWSGSTGGISATHTHDITTGTESAWHQHGFTTGNMSTNSSHGHTVNQSDAGGGGAHNNIQPSLVVYMWVRTT